MNEIKFTRRHKGTLQEIKSCNGTYSKTWAKKTCDDLRRLTLIFDSKVQSNCWDINARGIEKLKAAP